MNESGSASGNELHLGTYIADSSSLYRTRSHLQTGSLGGQSVQILVLRTASDNLKSRYRTG